MDIVARVIRLPELSTEVPGPLSRALAERLARVEAPGVTCLDPSLWTPVFWERGEGLAIVDVDGNRFLDATSAFGASALGHAHPAVAAAIAEQSARLVHGMGDVHPTRLKVELCERLAERGPWEEGARILLASTGAEAVEGALKTARLASGKPRILAFEGGYHGLTYGTLACTHREHFRSPFADQLRSDLVVHAPCSLAGLDALDERALEGVGAILCEPIQGRGGVVVPEPGFWSRLFELSRRLGAILIADEVFTGCGRTGVFLASVLEGVEPDLIVLGKALASGFPLSAVLGRAAVMNAWPVSHGDAIHTSTHLGNPLGCAAALASLEELDRGDWIENAHERGGTLACGLAELATRHPGAVATTRGRGLMQALVLEDARLAPALLTAALRRGLFLLGAGEHGEAIELTPPLVLGEEHVRSILRLLEDSLIEVTEVGV